MVDAKNKYEASRALNELQERREAGLLTDTGIFGPRIFPMPEIENADPTPGLLRPQAG